MVFNPFIWCFSVSSNNSFNNLFTEQELADRAIQMEYLARLQEQQRVTAQERREIVKRDDELKRTICQLQNVCFIYILFLFKC